MEFAGKQYITYGTRNAVFKIYALADIHFGHIGCNKELLRRDIRRIKDDPYAIWFGVGDYADFIAPDDKRWSAGCIDEEITVKDLGRLGKRQMEWVRDELDCIKSRCLGMLLGNHEAKYMSAKDQSDLHTWLCKEMHVPNLGYCGMTDLIFVNGRVKNPTVTHNCNPFEKKNEAGHRITLRTFLHHGFSGATTPAGKLNTLAKAMSYFDADLYFMGHVHEQRPHRVITVGADAECRHRVNRERMGMITGSYLETYTEGSTGYGEVKCYPPVKLGCVYAEFDIKTRELHARY